MIIKDNFGRSINTDMMACDSCGKRVAVKGIRVREFQAGEYQVCFFSCPHCGHKFLASATDEEQRDRLAHIRQARRKVQIAVKKHYRKQTISKLRQEMLRLTDEARARNGFLSQVGNRLLAGEELTAELISECRTVAEAADHSGEIADEAPPLERFEVIQLLRAYRDSEAELRMLEKLDLPENQKSRDRELLQQFRQDISTALNSLEYAQKDMILSHYVRGQKWEFVRRKHSYSEKQTRNISNAGITTLGKLLSGSKAACQLLHRASEEHTT